MRAIVTTRNGNVDAMKVETRPDPVAEKGQVLIRTKAAGLNFEHYRDSQFYQGRGCPECHGTGFKGRLAITEFLDLSDTIREMILDRRPSSELRKAAMAEGLTSLRQAGVEKVVRGETTLREINRITFIEPV